MSTLSRSIALTRFAITLALLGIALSPPVRSAEIMVQQVADLQLDYDRRNAQLAIAAMQRVWLLPGSGGTATAITPVGLSLSEPKFSPSGEQIVVAGGWHRDQQHLWLIDVASRDIQQLTNGEWHDTTPSWHSDGKHVVFTSDRGENRDIWQLNTVTGSTQALTRTRGDAFDPTVSADGTQLLFVLHEHGRFSVQRKAIAMSSSAVALVTTSAEIAKPQFRYDGFSVTYLQTQGQQRRLVLLLPVRELLSKALHSNRLLGRSAIAWRDRNHYYCVEDGRITLRKLAAATSVRDIPITLWLSTRERPLSPGSLAADDDESNAPGRWVLRAQRVLAADGLRYLSNHDVLINDGQIERIVAAQPWPDLNVVDLGDAAVIPGLIDTRHAGEQTVSRSNLLAAGITLQVSDDQTEIVDLTTVNDNRERLQVLRAETDQRIVVSDQLFPDALEGANWITLAGILAHSTQTLTTAQSTLIGRSQLRIPSELGATLGIPVSVLETLSRSRLYRGQDSARNRATPLPPILPALTPWLIAASGDSPIAQPLALHAELLALEHAGLPASSVLAMATSQAAAAVGRDDVGSVAPGNVANLVVVSGDPLTRSVDLLNTIVIVHRGRFASVASLLDDNRLPNVE